MKSIILFLTAFFLTSAAFACNCQVIKEWKGSTPVYDCILNVWGFENAVSSKGPEGGQWNCLQACIAIESNREINGHPACTWQGRAADAW